MGPGNQGEVAARLTKPQTELLHLWRERRVKRRWPARSDMTDSALSPWLGSFHLLRVEAGANDYRYEIYAKSLTAHRERDLTGKLVSETPEPELRAILLACYGEVCARGVPSLVRRPTVVFGRPDAAGSGDRKLPFETVRNWLMLPLGETDDAIDHLLSIRDNLHPEQGTSDSIEFVPLEGDAAPYWREIDDILRRT